MVKKRNVLVYLDLKYDSMFIDLQIEHFKRLEKIGFCEKELIGIEIMYDRVFGILQEVSSLKDFIRSEILNHLIKSLEIVKQKNAEFSQLFFEEKSLN